MSTATSDSEDDGCVCLVVCDGPCRRRVLIASSSRPADNESTWDLQCANTLHVLTQTVTEAEGLAFQPTVSIEEKKHLMTSYKSVVKMMKSDIKLLENLLEEWLAINFNKLSSQKVVECGDRKRHVFLLLSNYGRVLKQMKEDSKIFESPSGYLRMNSLRLQSLTSDIEILKRELSEAKGYETLKYHITEYESEKKSPN